MDDPEERSRVCFICRDPCFKIDFSATSQSYLTSASEVLTKRKKGRPRKRCNRARKDEGQIIHPELRVFFVVRHVFNCSVEDEGVLEMLRTNGNPSEWLEMCGKCGELVDQGIDVYRTLQLYQRKHKEMVSSIINNYGTFNAENLGLEAEESDKLNMNKLLNFHKKIRSLVIENNYEVKNEPLSDSDELCLPIMDQEFVPKNVQCQLPVQPSSPIDVEVDLDWLPDSPSLPNGPPTLKKPPGRKHKYGKGLNDPSSGSEELSDEPDPEWIPDESPPTPEKPILISTPRKRKRKRCTQLQTHKGPPSPNSWNKYISDLSSSQDLPAADTNSPNDATIIDSSQTDEIEIKSDINAQPVENQSKSLKEAALHVRGSRNCQYEGVIKTLRSRKIKRGHKFYKRKMPVYYCGCDLNLKAKLEKLKKSNSKKAIKTEVRKRDSVGNSYYDNLNEGDEDDEGSMSTDKDGRRQMLSWNLFSKECDEYLDMSLMEYPPTSEKEMERIPKSGRCKVFEEGEAKEGKYWCPSCPKRFSWKYFAIAHIHRTHMKIKEPWKCNKCSATMVRSRQFRVHLLQHKLGIIKICDLCGFHCKKQTILDSHLIDHERSSPSPKCFVCSATFASFIAFKTHMADHHGIARKLYDKHLICEMCSEAFSFERQLDFHKVKVHKEEDKNQLFSFCTECPEVFPTFNEMTRHVENIHRGISNQFFCEICGKVWNSQGQLTFHIKRCHEMEPSTCLICNLQFSNSARMKKHQRVIHPECALMSLEEIDAYVKRRKEEMSFGCTQCAARFPFRNLLSHHQRNDHGSGLRFKCTDCSKEFTRQSSVKRHYETTHLKLKTNCEFCGKEFNKDGLYQHQKYCSEKKKRDKLQSPGETLLISKQTPNLEETHTFQPSCEN